MTHRKSTLSKHRVSVIEYSNMERVMGITNTVRRRSQRCDDDDYDNPGNGVEGDNDDDDE